MNLIIQNYILTCNFITSLKRTVEMGHIIRINQHSLPNKLRIRNTKNTREINFTSY